MLEGLVSWLGGPLFALFVWAGFGEFIAFALWIVLIIWSKGEMPMRTQIDQQTGIKRTGALTWLLVLSGFWTSLPVGIMVYKLLHVSVLAVVALLSWVLAHWWMFALAGSLAAVGFVAVRVRRRTDRLPPIVPMPVLAAPEPAPAPLEQAPPVMGWSLASGVGQWDQPQAGR